jgi:hypothetical protein
MFVVNISAARLVAELPNVCGAMALRHRFDNVFCELNISAARLEAELPTACGAMALRHRFDNVCCELNISVDRLVAELPSAGLWLKGIVSVIHTN